MKLQELKTRLKKALRVLKGESVVFASEIPKINPCARIGQKKVEVLPFYIKYVYRGRDYVEINEYKKRIKTTLLYQVGHQMEKEGLLDVKDDGESLFIELDLVKIEK